MEILAVTIMLLCDLVGLVLVPLGLPGLWVMVGGFLIYAAASGFRTAGTWSIVTVVGLSFAGEVLENWLGFRFARRYGGSSRSGWGALIGGLIGTGMGIPIPILGSVIGAFIGAFAGAVVFEYSGSRKLQVAVGAGWGAVLGRAAAAAAKIALGLVIAVIGVVAALRGVAP
jgi:uncharacterized protein YqgC (DUF456 family)